MEKLTDKVCIFQKSLGSDKRATMRENRIIRAKGDFRLAKVGDHLIDGRFWVTPEGEDCQPRSGHQCLRALPRADRAGTRSSPECHCHLAGLGFRSRLSPWLPDPERFVWRLRGPESPQAVGIILTPPPPRSYPQMRAAELADQVAGGTMSTAPKTSRKATT
jgi:hypothetical protein